MPQAVAPNSLYGAPPIHYSGLPGQLVWAPPDSQSFHTAPQVRTIMHYTIQGVNLLGLGLSVGCLVWHPNYSFPDKEKFLARVEWLPVTSCSHTRTHRQLTIRLVYDRVTAHTYTQQQVSILYGQGSMCIVVFTASSPLTNLQKI